jgi:hypothetical protein
MVERSGLQASILSALSATRLIMFIAPPGKAIADLADMVRRGAAAPANGCSPYLAPLAAEGAELSRHRFATPQVLNDIIFLT